MQKRPDGDNIRVLRLFSRLNIGGPSVHVILLTAGLKERGYETTLVVGRESKSEGNLLGLAREKGVECVEVSALGREIRPFSDVVAFWALYRMIRRLRPHVVHTHAAKAGLLGRLAARLAGVPAIVHTYHGHVLRGYFGPVRTRLFRALETALSRITDAPVTVSARVADELAELGVAPREAFRIVRLGLDLERFRRPRPRGALRGEAGWGDDLFVVAVVGRLVPIKDVPMFLRAAAEVARERPEARFAVIGDGELRGALDAEVSALGLAGRVHFFGWRADLEEVYADVDLVVNSSRNEGTPVALIEALAAGKPVVATAVGGTPDLLAGGAFGALVPSGDAPALARAILDVRARPEPAAERSRAAQAHVLAAYSQERLLRDIDALYRELLQRGAAAA